MDRAALEGLERRLKEATGPDQQLDFDIYRLAFPDTQTWNDKLCRWQWAHYFQLHSPEYTNSIDDALSLVKWMFPGAAYILNGFRVATKPTDVWAYKCHLSDGCSGLGDGPTQALAILLALVSALKTK